MVRIDGTLAWVAASDVHRFEEEQRAAVAAAGPGERGQRAAAHRAACGGGIVPSFLLQAQQSLQDLLGSLHAEDIAGVVALPFRAKQDWFAEQCGKVRIPYSDGRKSLEVERSRIVESTAAACRSIDQRDYRKTWRIRFKGEEGEARLRQCAAARHGGEPSAAFAPTALLRPVPCKRRRT